MSIHVDGLAELIRDLDRAPARVVKNSVKAVTVWSHKTRDDWRQRDSGLAHAPAYPYFISYDVSVSGFTVTGEVGPSNVGQGALGGPIEFGTVNNPPHGSGAAAAAAQLPDLMYGLAVALGDAL